MRMYLVETTLNKQQLELLLVAEGHETLVDHIDGEDELIEEYDGPREFSRNVLPTKIFMS